jgi:protein phosphatase
LLFALVLVGAVLIVHWYAYSTYYIGNDAGTIAVYQGQPSGVLWFKPVRVFDTSYPVTQLLPADQKALDATISEATLTDALKYATHIRNMWRVQQSTLNKSTTTTIQSTSTTVKSTTTTIKKATG